MLRSRCARIVLSCFSVGILSAGCGRSAYEGGQAQSAREYTAYPGPSAAKPLPAPESPASAPVPVESAVSVGQAPTADLGVGPGQAGDKYAYFRDNNFLAVRDQPLSTFSLDVDTASYSKTRMYLMERGVLPPVDAVRIEEFVNYFEYDYAPPTNGDPFAMHVEVADCPWRPGHALARIGLKGREVEEERPPCNLVFLVDVSGSMASPQKIGLVKQSLRMLTSQLTARDKVAMVVYASHEGLVLPATNGDRRAEILAALERLEAGGSTNGGAGIRLAYSVAKEQLNHDGMNRVILCTDGDFNVGVTSTGDLVRLAEQEARAGIFLTVLGFGMGNHNDAMLEEISNKANGAYAFIDNEAEARKVFVEQINSTLVTIAKDVKIQVEFNPALVAAYRLIGYENRLLQAHEFNDDRKDAGDVGAGHTVTALYELVLAGTDEPSGAARIDPLKYQHPALPAPAADREELLTVKLRYKDPHADRSQVLTRGVACGDRRFAEASADFRFAACVAAFGMLLRQSEQAGDVNWDAVLEMAGASIGTDRRGYRGEFLEMVQVARRLSPPHDRKSAQLWMPLPTVRIATPSSAPPASALPAPSRHDLLGLGVIVFVALNVYAVLVVSLIIVCSSRNRCQPKLAGPRALRELKGS